MAHDLIKRRRLTLMLTYRCNAQCQDCGTFSSPHDKNDISLETACRALDWARDCGMSSVVFTGGESTLRWDDLLAALRHARTLEFGTRLVTNGQWATDVAAAKAGVSALVAAGLNEINFSTGDEHLRFVPLDHVLNAIQASLEAGMTIALMYELRANSKLCDQDLLAKINTLAPAETIARLFTFIRSPWMPIKPGNIQDYPDGVYANSKNIAFREGCSSVLRDYVVQATGNIAPCCGLGMRSVPELQTAHVTDAAAADGANPLAQAIAASEDDVFLYALHKFGPEKILAWAATKDPSIVWENMYGHHCQACMRLYKDPKLKTLVQEHFEELLADLIYSGTVLEQFEQTVGQIRPASTITHFV